MGRRVLIQVEEPEVKTSGGILLPSSAQKKPTKGSIVDAGNASIVQVRERDIREEDRSA